MRIFNILAVATALGTGIVALPPAGGAAFAQTQTGEAPARAVAQISVSGEGRVEVAPDMATLTLGVVTEGATAAEAMGANATAQQAVLERLTAVGIAPRDVQTSGLGLDPAYTTSTSEQEPPRISGFTARNMVTVRIRGVEKVSAVLDAALENGANSLYGLSFGLQEPEPRLDEARRAAIADARRKAELYAGAAGVTLGRVVAISEQSGYAMPMADSIGASFKAASVPVAGGEMSVGASVSVVYELAE